MTTRQITEPDESHLRGQQAEYSTLDRLEEREKKEGVILNTVHTNLTKHGTHEYDIIALNDKITLLIEVKYRMRLYDIKRLIKYQWPRFSTEFPEYVRNTVLLGVGYISITQRAHAYAVQNDLIILGPAPI